MSRHRVKTHPFIESMLNSAMLAQMAYPGENGGRPPFMPGVIPALPEEQRENFVRAPIDWESPYAEESYYSTREEEIDDMAP